MSNIFKQPQQNTPPQAAWSTLTPEQIQHFDQQGFLIIPQVIDAQRVQELITAGDRLIASPALRFRRDIGNSDGFRNAIALDPVFLDLIDHATILPFIIQLMGPHIQLHTSDLIWKHPDPEDAPADYRNPGWHRDIARVTRDLDHDRMPRLEIKAAYFLSDCSKSQSGQTLVAAGSHRWREAWAPTPEQRDPPGCTEALMQAGDVLLFENRTWHAGGSNKINQVRKTLMLGYSHNWIRTDDYDAQDTELLNHCNPIQRCLLEQINCSFDELGRFRPCVRESVIEQWAAQFGNNQAACH